MTNGIENRWEINANDSSSISGSKYIYLINEDSNERLKQQLKKEKINSS